MNTYYNPDDLRKFSTVGEEAPELWDKFMAYYGGSMADGALTAREKALISTPRTCCRWAWRKSRSWRRST